MSVVPTIPDRTRVYLPLGLIGLGELKEFELISDPSVRPFLLLRSLDPDQIEFVAIEPQGLIPDYDLELADEDAIELGVKEQSPLILNLTTIKSLSPQKVTANLAAPIVVNRKTGTGKQVVLLNHQRYSINYPLIDEAP